VVSAEPVARGESMQRTDAAPPPHVAATSAERPIRTRFAVGLQLGRMFPTLLGLVRQQYARDPAETVSAELIAQAVIDGARDRSRDAHLRPLLDLQKRTAPLTRTRRRRRKAPRPVRKPRRAPPPKLLCGGTPSARVENLRSTQRPP